MNSIALSVMADKVYDLDEAARITKMKPRTLRKYLKELDLPTVVYSVNSIQLTEEILEKLKEYCIERAKKTRQIRRDNINKVRPQKV